MQSLLVRKKYRNEPKCRSLLSLFVKLFVQSRSKVDQYIKRISIIFLLTKKVIQ